MISIMKYEFNGYLNMIELAGLSSDSKPIDEYKGYPVNNGSVFYEMDTHEVFMYDKETKTWIKQ